MELQFDYLWLFCKVAILIIISLLMWLGACYLDRKGDK